MISIANTTKLKILDAAATAFATHGVDQTSLDDIARALGATKGKIYHHFGSKGELVCAIRKHSVQLTLDRVHPYFAAKAPPHEKFHAMAKAHATAMISELAYHRVVVEEMRGSGTGTITDNEHNLRLEITVLQSKYEDMFRSVLASGIAAGQFRDQDLSVTVRSFLMMLHAPIYWYQPRGPQNSHSIAMQLADMALGAVLVTHVKKSVTAIVQ
ncbi:MAG: TetR/AcrR family transcriptional regulator [Planktomarina sp.]|nr:TetR/AcrR family transcriptional regulator [Planktomarina sp.]MDT2072618.1 TetR/AcrR family transcriptional regulator [Planktomarina sp.]